MRLASRFTDNWALGITLCWVVVLALTGATEVVLFIAPALLIAIPLFGGRYIGEELIVRLVGRRARPRRAVVSARVPSVLWAPDRAHPRGARLIAFSLAKRPPPVRLRMQN